MKREKITSEPSTVGNLATAVDIHIVSDSTGNLATHMLNSVLNQFADVEVQTHLHRFQRSPEEVSQTIASIRGSNAFVVHALTTPKLKRAVADACSRVAIREFDLTSPLVDFLTDVLGSTAANDLSLVHSVDSHYFDRIDAMEFALQHDDNQRQDSLHAADIVLLGLSRVGKSPTALYLSSMGFKTANVSISPETGFPPQLSQCEGKCVALIVQPKQLAAIRQRRFHLNGFSSALKTIDTQVPYTELRRIVRECSYAVTEYQNRNYPIIDVTNKTIEETAAEVLEILNINDGSDYRAVSSAG